MKALHQKKKDVDDEDEKTAVEDEHELMTKEEIFKQLQLDSTSHGYDLSKGTYSRDAITDGLCEYINKEIEKLRRQTDNVQRKITVAKGGEVEDDDDPDTKATKLGAQYADELEEEGCTMIYSHAGNPVRIQAMRHQTGQLGGLGSITIEEVQAQQ